MPQPFDQFLSDGDQGVLLLLRQFRRHVELTLIICLNLVEEDGGVLAGDARWIFGEGHTPAALSLRYCLLLLVKLLQFRWGGLPLFGRAVSRGVPLLVGVRHGTGCAGNSPLRPVARASGDVDHPVFDI